MLTSKALAVVGQGQPDVRLPNDSTFFQGSEEENCRHAFTKIWFIQ